MKDRAGGQGTHIKVKVESSFSICYKTEVGVCMTKGGLLHKCCWDAALSCGNKFPDDPFKGNKTRKNKF